jgi:LmbE family N-acetylglucosaminyl deacetylase
VVTANEPGQPSTAARTPSVNLPVPSSALAIGAHPDDVEFGAGATLAKWAAHGCRVHHVVCTDGSKGTWDANADIGALARTRQAEQRDAARLLSGESAGDVIFLGYVDGELENTVDARRRLTEVIRRLRPQVILSHDPWKRYRLHPDHRNAGLLVCDAIVAARDPHFFADLGVAPHRPDTLLLWEADEVHHVEDVGGFVDRKLVALEAHTSQFESTMHAVDDAQLDAFRARISSRLTQLGTAYGLDAAEVFARIDDL